MKNLITISIADDKFVALLEAAKNAGRQVGRKEASRANVYGLQKDGEFSFMTTFDGQVPGLYSVLLGSVRWSNSNDKYVVVVNDFIPSLSDEHSGLYSALCEGLAVGQEEYTAANVVADKLEGLAGRILIETTSTYSNSATFKDKEDAELWVTQKAGAKQVKTSVDFVSFENDTLVHEIIGKIAEETGETLDGLWKGYVSNVEIA